MSILSSISLRQVDSSLKRSKWFECPLPSSLSNHGQATKQLTLTQQFRTFKFIFFGTIAEQTAYLFSRRAFLYHGRKLPSKLRNYRELTMKRLNRLTIAVVASSLLAAPAVYAAPASISSPVHAMFGKTKTSTVKLSLRNDSGAPMEVKVGDKVMTLDPGKPVSLNLEVGTRIVANSATPNHPAGSLIEEVISDHNGATIIIR
jgi:hypothetical protein